MLIIHYNADVFASCRYDGDAVIKVNMAGGMSAGIKQISVSDEVWQYCSDVSTLKYFLTN